MGFRFMEGLWDMRLGLTVLVVVEKVLVVMTVVVEISISIVLRLFFSLNLGQLTFLAPVLPEMMLLLIVKSMCLPIFIYIRAHVN